MKLLSKLANRLGTEVCFHCAAPRGHALSVGVDHQRITLDCPSHELQLQPEALGTAFLIPSLSQRRQMVLDSANASWHANQPKLQSMLADWWGYEPRPVQVGTVRPPAPRGLGRVGLAFSLGIDSMYSCFFAEPRPNLLLLVGGFDVPHNQHATIDAMAASARAVAAELGMDCAVVRTNLRRNHLFRRQSWERTYGSAVAFVGLALAEHIDTLLISAGQHRDDLMPHGSHPELDPLWGTSYLRIQHVGHEATRLEKMQRIVSDPVSRELFRKHMRVCFISPNPQGNCGRCRKCVGVKLGLLKLDAGFCPETMPNDRPLHELIDQMELLTDPASIAYRKELLGLSDARVDQALRRYLERSEAALEARSAN
ncbi:MAG TPA: hypothetical protein PKA16_05675 [Ottowia sp.]|uniref:hypothetical protein n=1 Tax=Ottowia sp. TaxID=1898956 RepID=UPI002CEE7F08|nr:hypothetical protein [Ottowia sp.]HMN20865.1 hypothetical protein [Ottowia sp.]